MMYLNYELARQLVEERRARAAHQARRRRQQSERELVYPGPPHDAGVIELVFGAQCEPDRIGA